MSDSQYAKLDGNADLVLSKAKSYQDLAGAIENALVALDAIVDDTGTTAQAMEKTRALAGDVRGDIKKATARYRVTGDALAGYAPTLDSSISSSDTAATKIAELELDLSAARTAKSNAEMSALDSPDASPADKATADNELTTATNRVDSLETSLAYWQGQWQEAKDAKDTAANTARTSIDEQFERDSVNDLEDSWTDKVGEVLSSIYKVFKIICDIAGILAIFLSWVPVLGQVLLVLAAIGSILTILESVVKFANGEIGWGGLLLGVGLGVVGLFGGKLAGTLGKVAKARAVTNAAATTNSTSRLATRLAGNVDDGTRMISEARTTVANADNLLSMKSIMKSPFTRSDAAQELFELRKAGNLPFLEGMSRAAKDAFVFPLKSPLGGSGELLRNPALFHNADGLVGATVGTNLVNFGSNVYKGADGISTAFTGNDTWAQVNSVIGGASPAMDGPYAGLAQIPGKVVGWSQTVDGIF